MFLVTGFNEFNQLDELLDRKESKNYFSKLVSCNLDDVEDFCFSWSSLLVVKKNSLSVSGFLNGDVVKSKKLNFPFNHKVIQVSASKERWLLLTEDKECFEYANEKWRPLSHMFPQTCNDRPNIVKVLCGSTLTIGLSDQGVVYNIPNVLNFNGAHIIDIACGFEHGVALSDDGRVFTWGSGTRGQLGSGSLESSEEPILIEELDGIKVIKISAGGWHSAVLSKDGDVYTWGWNKQGQLGHPCINSKVWEGKVGVLAHPRVVDFPQGLDVTVESVSCGTSHTIVKLDNGEVWGCGWNRWGQLGLDETKFTDSMTKLDIPEDFKVLKVHCGAWNTILHCDKK